MKTIWTETIEESVTLLKQFKKEGWIVIEDLDLKFNWFKFDHLFHFKITK